MVSETYLVTVAIDHGELPSGNARTTSKESAIVIIEELAGYSTEMYGTELISTPSFEDGDTTWVVGVTAKLSEEAVETVESHNFVEDVEKVAVV